MIYGYAQANEDRQALDNQLDAIREYGVDEIYQEGLISPANNCQELYTLFKRLRAGDTLVILTLEFIEFTLTQLSDTLNNSGINIVVLQQEIHRNKIEGKEKYNGE